MKLQSNYNQNPALHIRFSFKILFSNCSIFQSKLTFKYTIGQKLSEYLFLLLCQTQSSGTLRPSSFGVHCQLNNQKSKRFYQHFNFLAALSTICYGKQSRAWYPFTLCLKLYIPLQHLYRIIQMIEIIFPILVHST